MTENKKFFSFCVGSQLKNTDVLISLPPDIAFRLDALASEKGTDLTEYIESVLSEHAEKAIPKNKKFYEKYF